MTTQTKTRDSTVDVIAACVTTDLRAEDPSYCFVHGYQRIPPHTRPPPRAVMNSTLSCRAIQAAGFPSLRRFLRSEPWAALA